MVNAVFVHKPDSKYDDRPDQFYHFPKSYLSRVEQTVGDRIVYYGPLIGQKSWFYLATAKVTRIRPDVTKTDFHYADVDEYVDFDNAVDYRSKGGFEVKLIAEDGAVNGETVRSSVRLVTPPEFEKIINA